MLIGFDLDKVLINYPPFVPATIIDRIYKKKSKGGDPIYRYPSKIEQKIRILSHASFLRKPISKNIEAVKNLDRNNHKLFLISSRFSFLKKITEKLIKDLSLDNIFNGLYFNFGDEQPHIFKSRIIKKNKLDIYVDDDFHLIKYAAKNNKNTIFFWLNNKIDNQKLTRNIIAVKQIKSILRFIK